MEPRLVFTRITPLAPRIPYILVATASFNTLTDSISSDDNSLIERSKPSTNTNGFLEFVVPSPRIYMVGPSSHAAPEFCNTCKPDNVPNN